MIRAGPRASASSSLTNRPSRNDDSRWGRRGEEVQGRARGGRVSGEQVVAAGRVGVALELAELLQRHVLLGPRERRQQRDVERVLEDLLRLLRGRLRLHHLVEGPLHVEHRRVERGPVARRPRRPAAGCCREPRCPSTAPAVDQVDGEHHDLPGRARRPGAPGPRTWWSCRRRRSRSGGRCSVPGRRSARRRRGPGWDAGRGGPRADPQVRAADFMPWSRRAPARA